MKKEPFDSFILFFSDWVIQKLRIHGLTEIDVEEAFFLHEGRYLVDTRTQHRTKPPTVWFISQNSEGRIIKVVLKVDVELMVAIVKTAYEPSRDEVELYEET